MENITESVKSIPKGSVGFFKQVFNFDDENKCEMLNMIQYTIIAIIPVMIILKAIKHIVPEEDDSKGSLEILAESVGQIVLIILAIWFTNKIIHYIPTYSECSYAKLNSTNFIIPLLIILTTMQTKFGMKLNILFDRVTDFCTGKVNDGKKEGKSNKASSHPASKQGQAVHQPSQSDYRDLSQILPSNPQMSTMPSYQQPSVSQIAMQEHGMHQSSPDFNSMYQGPNTPLANAQSPGGGMMEPMAANEGFSAFGGSAW